MAIRKDIDEKREHIVNSLLSNEKTLTELCRELNCKPETLRVRINKWIPDYRPDYTAKIRKMGGRNQWGSLTEYVAAKGKSCKRDVIYRLLVKERGGKCEECGNLSEWNGKFLRLQVDHIDGQCYNNKEENLRLLCPNCHSQTSTFANRKSLAQVVELVDTAILGVAA